MIGHSNLTKYTPDNESQALGNLPSQLQTPQLVSLSSTVAFEGLKVTILGAL